MIAIANINVWNRLDVATRQVVGSVEWDPVSSGQASPLRGAGPPGHRGGGRA